MGDDASGADGSAPHPVEVVESVADVLDADTIDLPPMHDYVDLEAIERLVSSAAGADESVVVRFEYQGLRVAVSPDGVETTPIDGVHAAPGSDTRCDNERGPSAGD